MIFDSSSLDKKISVKRQVSNSLDDSPKYMDLFSCYANIVFTAQSTFDSDKGTDISKVNLNITVRDSINWQNIDINNLFLQYKSKIYKIETIPIEVQDGFLSFNASLNI